MALYGLLEAVYGPVWTPVHLLVGGSCTPRPPGGSVHCQRTRGVNGYHCLFWTGAKELGLKVYNNQGWAMKPGYQYPTVPSIWPRTAIHPATYSLPAALYSPLQPPSTPTRTLPVHLPRNQASPRNQA